ncbi:hypothetical protein [Haloarcula litorea]|uniref:hypothetical protein n=1 Tax=Haloarcula litorea TaxID=3032579 RepID=UPI0023E889D4|nr:hypothetical protein [Halomicroarcula sp. GDY20]
MTAPELAPFDDELIRRVADANDADYEAIRDAVVAHQRGMRDNPGVENLVYEWRKQYDDPVLARTDETFVVAVPATVWEEFGDHLGLEGDVLTALAAVHQEQVVRRSDTEAAELPPDRVPVVVVRT